MKYLGFPLSDRRLGIQAFKDIVVKMRHKLQPWKGRNLSLGGRLTLTNTSLSSLPIYMMGFFHLHEGVHQQMDTIRSKFFWGSDGENFKYHMIKWENTCLPREFGGGWNN
jgi:hypothetical protein